VFVEDTVVLFRSVAVITRPGAESRRPETGEVEKVLESLGCSLNRIVAPGTLDGGDVLEGCVTCLSVRLRHLAD
jgi:dimethylargininase